MHEPTTTIRFITSIPAIIRSITKLIWENAQAITALWNIEVRACWNENTVCVAL